jgi:radical SAM protein with 4Fe4S-binding SPASM domain
MKNLTAILSTLHEPLNSGCVRRRFRGEPVLAWTLRRLRLCPALAHIAILCWEDQLAEIQPIAAGAAAFVLAKGPRCALPMIEAVAAVRKWSDGWRGGLLGACHFDLGFHAPWANEIVRKLQADAAVVLEPDAALVDPVLIGSLADHAQQHPQADYVFTPTAPGLNGILLRASLMEQLVAGSSWPGRMLCYWPDLPGRDPIAKDECAPAPTCAVRTTHRFVLDCERQLSRLERATMTLNGTLPQADASQLVARMDEATEAEKLPRDVVLEINTDRKSRPLFWPGRYAGIHRPPMTAQLADTIFAGLATMDDIRLTLGGVGDPFLADNVFEIIESAHRAGIRSIHVETDLLGLKENLIEKLLDSPIDMMSVSLPAATPQTYSAMMGIDGFAEAVENLKKLVLTRNQRQRGLPVVVPTFIKCDQNLHEMEGWYDHWLRAVGAAVIAGPADCGGLVDLPAVDMRPPKRVPCRRLRSRMTILSDGSVVACEQDVIPRQVLGRATERSIVDIWQQDIAQLRATHEAGQWSQHPTCAACREWHRP